MKTRREEVRLLYTVKMLWKSSFVSAFNRDDDTKSRLNNEVPNGNKDELKKIALSEVEAKLKLLTVTKSRRQKFTS